MTFHSACVRILRARGASARASPRTFSIYDADDSRRLMAQVVPRPATSTPSATRRGRRSQISNLKNELIDFETATARARQRHSSESWPRSTGVYQDGCAQANAMDFDDLIMTTVAAAAAFPGRRRALPAPVPPRAGRRVPGHQPRAVRPRPRAGRHRREGRGRRPSCASSATPTSPSTPSAARPSATSCEFEDDYPTRPTILLEQNYRSTQTILSAANAVISRNPDRKPKRLWSDAGDGEQDRRLRRRQRARRGGVRRQRDRPARRRGQASRACDVAVFYRTNAQSRVFEEVFIRVGLPYKVVGGVRFYERREVRDALAYLRVLANPADTVSLRRILNVPKRGIGDARGGDRDLRRARADHVRRGAARAPRGSGSGVAVAERDRGIHATDGRAGRRPGRRRPGEVLEAMLGPHRISRGAAGQPRPAGRGPGREPRGAGVGRPRVRADRPEGGLPSAISWSRSRWSPTPTRSRGRTARTGWSR